MVTFDLGNSYPPTTSNFIFILNTSPIYHIFGLNSFIVRQHFETGVFIYLDETLSLLGNTLKLGYFAHFCLPQQCKGYACTSCIQVALHVYIVSIDPKRNHFFQQIMIQSDLTTPNWHIKSLFYNKGEKLNWLLPIFECNFGQVCLTLWNVCPTPIYKCCFLKFKLKKQMSFGEVY